MKAACKCEASIEGKCGLMIIRGASIIESNVRGKYNSRIGS